MCGVLINQTKLIVALGDDVGFEYLPHHAQRQAGGCPGAKVVCSGGMSAWAVGSLWVMGSALRPVADFPSSGSSGDSIFSSWAGAGCCARAVVTAGSALGCCSGRSGRMSSRSSCAVCGAGAANCGGLGGIKWCPHRVQLHHSAGTGQRAGRHRGRELIQCAVLCRGKGVEMLLAAAAAGPVQPQAAGG